MLELLRADDSTDPLPALELHVELAQQYGRDMLALDLTPQTLLEEARASRTPLRTLLQALDHIGGYKEDPLRKTNLFKKLLQTQNYKVRTLVLLMALPVQCPMTQHSS